MRTKKAISTISYNTPEFLDLVLKDLYEDGVISDYMYVYHLKEDDENKNHIHLYIQPNRLVDTMKLQQKFIELDPDRPDKPLKCIDFKSSNSDDWILYCRHYPPYLASKGQDRHYEYSKDLFCYADEDNFNFLWDHAMTASDWVLKYNVTKDLRSGLTPLELINSGRVPLSLAGNLIAYERMKHQVYRAGRKGHD